MRITLLILGAIMASAMNLAGETISPLAQRLRKSAPISIENDAIVIVIGVHEQKMRVFDGDKLLREYTISTARNGLGCEANSGKTPFGWHIVRERIGDGLPLNQVFVARKPASRGEGDDWVMTRILWLDGLEKINRNSHSRFIYIHGTNHEELLGSEASHGCIRMSNRDVLELFEKVRGLATYVLIMSRLPE